MTETKTAKPVHQWLRKVRVVHVPGPSTPLLERLMFQLMHCFGALGHELQETPTEQTDAVITTARFGEDLGWRDAPMFTARRRYSLRRSPTVFTVVHATPEAFQCTLDRLAAALVVEPPDPSGFDFPGLAPQAWQVLVEQGRRGGPIMALERLVQAQTKCIRVVLVVGDEAPIEAYHFDLAGGHPRTDARDLDGFFEDVVLRIATATSTTEVTQHLVVGKPIPLPVWKALSTPPAMRRAGQELGKREFFTAMIRIADLTLVPALTDSLASQYSEGCFATWDPDLQALMATVTGSASPVNKGNLTDEDLAVIVAVRPDEQGALVREVAGRRNRPPSSEAVELIGMDAALPRIELDASWGIPQPVPVVRSKLHGHRGVRAFDPRYVEYVPLAQPYFYYIVSCATAAQAQGIKGAFSTSEALHHREDPRQVVFTVLPGHGTVIAEKWAPGKAPFELIWEYMDAGYLEVDNKIPQGPLLYAPGGDGRLWVTAIDE
ncbi:MAG: hypothetical protein FJZ90_05915 [Chloroflexi bacterium]|nr:hypothetical protein [Chloroflexota bacterium]